MDIEKSTWGWVWGGGWGGWRGEEIWEGSHNCLETHTDWAVSNQIWVWNWEKKNMLLSFRNREFYSNIQGPALTFIMQKMFPVQLLAWLSLAKSCAQSRNLVTIQNREHKKNSYLSQIAYIPGWTIICINLI